MAAHGEIHIKDETRPCFYKGERAMFHSPKKLNEYIGL